MAEAEITVNNGINDERITKETIKELLTLRITRKVTSSMVLK